MEGYAGLFVLAFLAATLLPGYSEVAFAGLLATGYEAFPLWAWATAGNTLGSVVNWGAGRWLLHYRGRRWFPVNAGQLERGQAWFQRFGVWSLLLAWAPVAGDALTFIAGVMRVRFDLFLLLTAVGKGLRYAVLLLLLEGAGVPAL